MGEDESFVECTTGLVLLLVGGKIVFFPFFLGAISWVDFLLGAICNFSSS